MMTPAVEAAVEEVRNAFPEATVTAVADPEGGAFVTVDSVDPGEQYNPRATWVKFHVTFQYPMADVYPHFVRPDLRRLDRPDISDGAPPLGEATAMGAFAGDGQPAIQLSRRSNKLNPTTDTALVKLMKVLSWLRSRS
jgi:hypothetical protein